MASSSNGNGNLVDEFEESFQACIHALTKHESATVTDKDEMSLDVDQTTIKFVDLARQMEAFFIQKRFLLSALKPELVLKEENYDLKYEISRKEDLIQRHYEKIESWRNLLAYPQQQSGGEGSSQAMNSDMRMVGGGGGSGGGLTPNASQQGGGGVGGPMGPGGGAAMSNAMQAQMQAQQQHQLQQSQQMLQNQLQHMQQQVGPQQMFMQQGGGGGSGVGGGGGVGVAGGAIATGAGGRGGFNQSQNVLHGPLAYLEKTTTNIDLVGIGDGRR